MRNGVVWGGVPQRRTMIRDEAEISRAKTSLVNCAHEWIDKLVALGVDPTELNDTLEQIRQRAIISMNQRKE